MVIFINIIEQELQTLFSNFCILIGNLFISNTLFILPRFLSHFIVSLLDAQLRSCNLETESTAVVSEFPRDNISV